MGTNDEDEEFQSEEIVKIEERYDISTRESCPPANSEMSSNEKRKDLVTGEVETLSFRKCIRDREWADR